MSKIHKITFAFILSAVFLAVFAPILLTAGDTASAAHKEHPLYARLNDELIRIYEEDVAHEPVISSIPQEDIVKLAEKHGFSVKKTKALIILSDLSYRLGEPKSFSALAELRDREIIKLGKHLFDIYGKTLSKEEKKALKDKALAALKSD